MTTQRKPRKVHAIPCSQEEAIGHLLESNQRLSIIITGNGDPEKGIARKVALINERQAGVLVKLQDIHVSLENYHKEIDEAKTMANTVSGALERYKAEVSSSVKTEKEIRAETRAERMKFLQTASVIIATIMLCITAVFSFVNHRQSIKNANNIEVTKDKIDELGTPVVINPRGVTVPLPPGDSLKYYRDGGLKDTMRGK
jgi:hypothetical protein